jgi:hypothetical protein
LIFANKAEPRITVAEVANKNILQLKWIEIFVSYLFKIEVDYFSGYDQSFPRIYL